MVYSKRWTKEDDLLLTDWYGSPNPNPEDIQLRLNRTWYAVYYRLRRLGLPPDAIGFPYPQKYFSTVKITDFPVQDPEAQRLEDHRFLDYADDARLTIIQAFLDFKDFNITNALGGLRDAGQLIQQMQTMARRRENGNE